MAMCKNILLPYIGTYLSDIIFTYEGNPDLVPGNPTLINLPKFEMVNRSIGGLLGSKNHTTKSYFQRKDPIYGLLKNLPFLDEKEMYAVSLMREPRGSNLKDIE
eukprot:TRINITY_DN2719_c2_g1_i1.p1 TRINITY_DN2719_c2_g1~~TRINITY_DN2719_c2_g1_i1.p1  ORF type:complete len:104 (-),score=23.99 TRINITY_DN2719_c2_g1_i1:60-371(-)